MKNEKPKGVSHVETANVGTKTAKRKRVGGLPLSRIRSTAHAETDDEGVQGSLFSGYAPQDALTISV